MSRMRRMLRRLSGFVGLLVAKIVNQSENTTWKSKVLNSKAAQRLFFSVKLIKSDPWWEKKSLLELPSPRLAASLKARCRHRANKFVEDG